MKRCVILINAYADKGGTRQTARLTEELIKLGISAEVRTNDAFSLQVKNGALVKSSLDFDFCVYLDKDKYIAAMLEKTGMRLFNRAKAIELCDDKMLTHIALSDKGIPMPDTMPGLLCYDEGAPLSPVIADEVEKRLGYPVVVKLSYGSIGKGVFKADDREALVSLCKSIKTQPHLFQKFIANSAGTDMRVIVIGGKAIGAMIRKSENDFRSNIGLGGTAYKAELPGDVKAIAERAADILELDYCGIDFVFAPEPMIIEVNSNAYFDAFENTTGINVAALYAKHIASCV